MTRVCSPPSRDGKDVTFFTHDVLVDQDHNGNLVKIYDAREEGGFYVQLKEPPCRASDECHGPGTQAPPPPDIGTYRGDGGQAEAQPPKKKPHCRGKRVRRHGVCVKARRQKRHQRSMAMAERKTRRNVRGMNLKHAPFYFAALTLLVAVLLVAPAHASEDIQAFEVVSTDSRVGMHPDFETNVTLQDAGLPETAQKPHRQPAAGHVRQPQRDPEMQFLGFRPLAMPGGLAGGRDQHPGQLRRQPGHPPGDGAGLRGRIPIGNRDDPLRLHRPDPEHPDQHPDIASDRVATTGCG